MKQKLILFLLILVPPIFYVVYVTFAQNHYKKLPFLGPKELVNTSIDGKMTQDTLYFTVGNFDLPAQEGRISNANLNDKFTVVSFVNPMNKGLYTTLSDHLRRTQETFINNDMVQILSFVNLPSSNVDTTGLSMALGNTVGKWDLLFSNDSVVSSIAQNYFLLENRNQVTGVFQSNKILIVDHKGRLRGEFDGTSKRDMDEMMGALRLLKIEYYNQNSKFETPFD
jgi:protein SCO1